MSLKSYHPIDEEDQGGLTRMKYLKSCATVSISPPKRSKNQLRRAKNGRRTIVVKGPRSSPTRETKRPSSTDDDDLYN